jgi:cobalt-zinc-cadmium efflux system protein
LSRQRRLALTLAANAAIVAAQVVFGFAAHSLGLLADAGHNLTDVAAVGLSLVAVRWATRAATSTRSYGYHRGTILAALANAASILAVTAFIAVEAIHRLSHPHPVRGALVVMVALGAFAVKAAAAVLLREGHGGHGHGDGDGGVEGDLNMRSAVLHMASDAAASLGVAAAGAVILVTGRFLWLDPAVSLGIGVLIAWHAVKLFGASVDVLLESTRPVSTSTGCRRPWPRSTGSRRSTICTCGACRVKCEPCRPMSFSTATPPSRRLRRWRAG